MRRNALSQAGNTSFLMLLGLMLCSTATAQDAAPEREITQIIDNLYSFRQIRHIGMFLVTNAGIVVVDPTNPEVSAWLKSELDRRFDVPVRYVVYSHSHNDHAGGGDVFADTAIFVGHENIRTNLRRPGEHAPLLPREQLWDKNGDGRLEEHEVGGFIGVDIAPNGFARFDTDNSGWLSRAEIWAARFGGPTVRPPDLYYSDKFTLTLGDQSVELHYLGKNHTDDMSLIYFPEHKVIYTVDSLIPNRLPWNSLDGGYLPDWVDWLKQVEQFDFDIVVPGHESPGTKADVTAQVHYMEELYVAVLEAIEAGMTPDEMVDTILMEDYSDMIEYEQSRAKNVIGAWEMIVSTLGQH